MASALQADFDAAVLNFVTAAISSEKIIAEIFAKIHRFLKGGGRLVVLNNNVEKSGGKEFLTHSLGPKPQNIGQPVKVFLGADRSLEIEDYYYNKGFYLKKLKEAGFEIENVSEPLAEDNNYTWKNESKYPPFLLISATAKKS